MTAEDVRKLERALERAQAQMRDPDPEVRRRARMMFVAVFTQSKAQA